MGEGKFASLSSGLLARKGGAKPAMRRQNYVNPEGDVHSDLGWNDMGEESVKQVDPENSEEHEAIEPEVHRQIEKLSGGLGQAKVTPLEFGTRTDALPDDVEDEPAEETAEEADAGDFGSLVTEETEVVTGVTASDVQSVISTKPRVQKKPAPEEKKVLARDKVAFTLRLDKDRHFKLRLASAVANRSAQQIVTEALDRFLEATPDIENISSTSNKKTKH